MPTKRTQVSRYSFRLIAIIALITTITFGLYQVYSLIQYKDQEYTDLVRLGNTGAAMLPIKLISSLNGVSGDTAKVEYRLIKNMLASIIRVNDQAAFSYLYVIRDGQMYFMVDSEPLDSRNYSPAGQIYEEATALDLTLMNQGATPIVEHSSDRWGKWVSILVPVHDPESGKHIAVFGMDFNSKEWDARMRYKVGLSVLIILLSIMAIAFILVIVSKSRRLEEEYEKLKKTEQELILAKEKAEEGNRLKTSFLQNMSHEIRTPLNAIVGFTGLLENEENTDEERMLYRKYVLDSSHRLLNTFNDILELSRLQAGQFSMKHSNVSINNLMHEISGYYKTLAKEKGLEFYCTIQETTSPMMIRSNAGFIASIFHKLLSNALKFTSTGHIEMGVTFQGSMAHFYVKDTGIGIDLSQHAYIFDDFRQVYESSSRNYDGNGLGLNIAKRLVTILGGEISVVSKPKEGSHFTFTVPVS